MKYIKYEEIKEKFLDKGMSVEFAYLVLSPPPFDNSRLMGTMEENIKNV